MVRKLDKWVLHELTTNQKNHHFKVLSSFILSNSGEPFLDRIMRCNKKWFLYNNQWWPAQWLDWEEGLKHFLKPNLHQKSSWSLLGSLLLLWSTTAFWIPVKPLHLRSMLSKSVRCTENCNTWVCHWLTERAQFFSTMADCMSHKQCFKSWMNWATKFYLLHHIHLTSCQLTTTSSIWTTFCRENASTTNRTQKMLSKSSLNPKAWIFML